MFKLKYLLLILCILSFYGILSAQVKFTQTEKNAFSLTLKKSDPHGQSSAYNLTIYSDGKYFFEGILGTKIKGNIGDSLSQAKINQLIDEIEKADFFSLKNAYTAESGNCPWIMLDSPTIILSIKLNEREKTVEHYLGCGEKENESDDRLKAFPLQLNILENKIDEIVETKRWIGESE